MVSDQIGEKEYYHAFLGIINIQKTDFLLMVTKVQLVCSLLQNPIYEIKDVKMIQIQPYPASREVKEYASYI